MGANRQIPASPPAGRATTEALERHDHPAGVRTDTLNGAHRCGLSKQQKMRDAPAGKVLLYAQALPPAASAIRCKPWAAVV